RRDRETEGLGGLQVEDQFELCRLLNREIGRLGPFQDTIHVGRRLSVFAGNGGCKVTRAPASANSLYWAKTGNDCRAAWSRMACLSKVTRTSSCTRSAWACPRAAA